MKNQREIYEALLAGEILDNGDFTVQLGVNGTLLDDEDDKISLGFNYPEYWSIYKEPKWYEDIPEGGVLCWYQNTISIVYHNVGNIDKYTPLTKQEIQVFMDNAPEES